MFTGIITAVRKITSTSHERGTMRVGIERPRGWDIKRGDSINIDGVCSTVRNLSAKIFEVEYMPETLALTTVPLFKKDSRVNLERSLRLSDRLDGHIVLGHVDTIGTVIDIKRAQTSAIAKISFPAAYKKFIAKKGSICVNGVSLTVVDVGKNWFSISLVRYTLDHTNLQNLVKGDKVNLEADMLARYLEALLAKK